MLGEIRVGEVADLALELQAMRERPPRKRGGAFPQPIPTAVWDEDNDTRIWSDGGLWAAQVEAAADKLELGLAGLQELLRVGLGRWLTPPEVDLIALYDDRYKAGTEHLAGVVVGPKFIEQAVAGNPIQGADYFIPMLIDADAREEVKRRFHAGMAQRDS